MEQWRDELKEKFDLTFDIVSREQIETSVTGNPFVERSRLLCATTWPRNPRRLQAKLQAALDWDLVMRQWDSAQLPVAPGLTKQQRLAQLLGVRYTNDRSRQGSAEPMCPFLLHVGLALDLDLHARIYQPFHLNERRDR